MGVQLSQLHQPSKKPSRSGTNQVSSGGALVSSAPTKQELHQPNRSDTIILVGALETSAPPISASLQVHPYFQQHFSPSNPQPYHAPYHLPKPSFRHSYSVWSLASLVSAGGGAVYHFSPCRLTSSDQTAGVVTHA